MLPKDKDKRVIFSGKGNYRGSYSNVKDAAKLYQGLCDNGLVNRDTRECDFKRMEKDKKAINSQIRIRFREFPALIENQLLTMPKEKECVKFVRMLEAAHNGEPNWRRNFQSNVADFFNTLVDPDYKIILRITELREGRDVEFVRTNWLENLNRELPATDIDGSSILRYFIRNGSKPKFLFVSNQLVVSELPSFVREVPSLKYIDILHYDILDYDLHYLIGKERGVDIDELKSNQLRILDTIKQLKKEFSNDIRIRVQTSNDILTSDPSLVVTDLNPDVGRFKLCISADLFETLYQSGCRCNFYGEPNKYISQVISRQISQFHIAS